MTKACELPAADAVPGVLAYLGALGYQLVEQSPGRALLGYKGHWWHARIENHSHELSVSSDGHRMLFGFFSNSIQGAYITDGERAVFEDRAGHAVESAHDRPAPVPQPPPPPARPAAATDAGAHVIERQVLVTRCKHCSAITPVDFGTCQHCGAPKFL